MTDRQTLALQGTHDARPAVALPSLRMNRCHAGIEGRVSGSTQAWPTLAPLQVTTARHIQLPTHPSRRVVVAMLLDPGIFHRDSFAIRLARAVHSPLRHLR